MFRVSSVLQLNGLSDPHKALDEVYRHRGHAIHSACEALADGYEPVVEEAHAGYVAALAKWFRSESPSIVALERRIVSRLRKLTGRIDLIVILDGKLWVIDLKTGSPAWWHAIQLALYVILVCDDDDLWQRAQQVAGPGILACRQPHLVGRGVLYLAANGRPSWKPQNDPQDFYIARSALALVSLRHEHGLIAWTDPEQPDDDVVTAQVETQPF